MNNIKLTHCLAVLKSGLSWNTSISDKEAHEYAAYFVKSVLTNLFRQDMSFEESFKALKQINLNLERDL